MDFLKNKKGVTMIALTITVVVLIIITSITLVNMKEYLQNQKRNKLYNDISNLKTKIDTYYMEHNEIPVLGKYCTKTELETILIANNAVNIVFDSDDNDNYYVIDLSKLDNVTLNYGKEYSTWTSGTSIQDLYIINEKTHQIYYPMGIKFQDEIYYCYDINTTTITVPDIESSINIENINISMSSQEHFVATGGQKSLTINVSISSDSEDITKYDYKYVVNQDSENVPNKDIYNDVILYDSTGIGEIVTDKLSVGNYYVWIKLTDNIATETDAICINKDNPVIIKESGITITEVSNSDGLANLTVEYDSSLFNEVSYDIGNNLENTKEKLSNIDNYSYTETTDETTGITTKKHTLSNIQIENYLYVQGTDINGNTTSSYMYINKSPVKISFTVFENECQGEEDMTWEEWINSSYNTIGVYASEEISDVFFIFYDGQRIYQSNGTTPVQLDSALIVNEAYGPID